MKFLWQGRKCLIECASQCGKTPQVQLWIQSHCELTFRFFLMCWSFLQNEIMDSVLGCYTEQAESKVSPHVFRLIALFPN
jgi:hypothetical protein